MKAPLLLRVVVGLCVIPRAAPFVAVPRARGGAASAAFSAVVDRPADVASAVAEYRFAADDGYELSMIGPAAAARAGATAVVLLHGRTWSSEGVWRQPGTLGALGCDAFALDFRHFGRTPSRADDFHVRPATCAADAARAVAAVRARGYARVALLGWSFGALVAQMVAARAADGDLDALVLYASVWDRAGLYHDVCGPFGCDVEPRGPQTLEDCLSDFTRDNVDRADAEAFARALLEADPVRADWADLEQFRVDLADVTCPTLVVAGDHDPHAPLAEQAALFAALGATTKKRVVVPDSDHVAHVTRNKAVFERAVRDFLRDATG